jgi:hypothetical protein
MRCRSRFAPTGTLPALTITIAKLGRDRLRTWKTLTGELPALAWRSDDRYKFTAEKLLHFSSACGVYLQRLATKLPNRFESKKTRANLSGPSNHENSNQKPIR